MKSGFTIGKIMAAILGMHYTPMTGAQRFNFISSSGGDGYPHRKKFKMNARRQGNRKVCPRP